VVERGEGVHFVVVDPVPGQVPAGVVEGDAVGEFEGSEVVADGGEAGHEGEIGAGDGEDEGVVGGVGGDDAVDVGGGGGEGVFGVADEVEGVARIHEEDSDEREDDGGGSEEARRVGVLVAKAGEVPVAFEDDGDEEGKGDGDDEVVPGLEVVVIGEEGDVAGGPKEERWDERVAEEADFHQGYEGGQQAERVEEGAEPHAVCEGGAEDGEGGRRRHAGVGVGAEEVAVVEKEVGSDEQAVVGEPDYSGDDERWDGKAEEGADAVSGAGVEEVCDGGEEEDGGGLGEDHGGDEET